MLGLGEDLVGRFQLDELTVVQHPDAMRDLPDDREVVRDEQVRHPGAFAQRREQAKNPGLGGHVECGGRLVADHQRHVPGKGAGDGDPLFLSTG